MIYKRAPQPNKTNLLSVEPLEPRMMLSTVTIQAAGDTGEEQIELQLNGETVQTFDLGTETQTFTYSSDANLSADQIRVAFVNDLYLPDEGIDRNVRVDSISVDGNEFSTRAPGTFAAGVWDSEQAKIVSGFELGDTLHANGYFQFSNQSSIQQIDFAGRSWDVVQGNPTYQVLSVDGNDVLTISGSNGPLAVSTQVDISSGDAFQFSFVADRPNDGSEFEIDNQPWATFGVNFYNDSGQLIEQSRYDLNGAAADLIEVVPLAEATSAFAWFWIDGDYRGVDVPLVVESFDVDVIEFGNDFEPPTVSLVPYTLTENNRTTVNFAVDFTDDVRLGNIPSNSLSITGPNGFSITPAIATGVPGNTDTFQRLIFTYSKPGGGEFTEADNGIYTVSVNPNTVSDFYGNFAATGVIGTYEIAIDALPEDNEAPTVVLLNESLVFTAPPTGGRGSDVQFTVQYTDNQGLGDLDSDRIQITGPNGYSGFGRGIAGGGADPNGFFEITYAPLPADGVWSENENGVYTISLLDNTVVDDSGNFTAGQSLGSFLVDIDDQGQVLG